MPDLIRLPADPKAKAAADAVLAQMYGYYAYDWAPFAPAIQPGTKQAA
jgi:hypothetical protein